MYLFVASQKISKKNNKITSTPKLKKYSKTCSNHNIDLYFQFYYWNESNIFHFEGQKVVLEFSHGGLELDGGKGELGGAH